ncbi:hypothetical protein [Carnimonas nigrificans]|uniref:hypothetical protein n=1 Tax=Carnimonas nigrificans TaxID=64323 RepID=UPI0004702E45|nr:hypothetical protein [Carnimonas nigrificans]
MGVSRFSIGVISAVVLLIVLPFIISSTLSLGYLSVGLASISHTLALGIAARVFGRGPFWACVIISLANLIALVYFSDLSFIHALLNR